MRARTLNEFIGQEHIVGEGHLLRRAIQADRLTSCIFYGPPGCGKTTLAAIIAGSTKAAFAKMNAVTSGVADVRKVLEAAEERQKLYGQATYLLLDECHRWNKAQSDSILPAIEKGIIRFIGSTTENPMVSMTPAIVSRCRLFQFYPLGIEAVLEGLYKALADRERGLGRMGVAADDDALSHIAHVANGDLRSALNALELAAMTTPQQRDGSVHITLAVAEESIQKPVLQYDESLYYDMLSAFCKSLRGSDPDAALAWFSRMTYAGVDPKIIVRRLIAHASEDVGLANPLAMLQTVAASQALQFIGMPEAKLSIAQAIIAVCESPKSNSVVMAVSAAMADAEKGGFGPVPVHLRDTSYKGHERLGTADGKRNGETYLYPHDFEGHWVEQRYMPEDLQGRVYYKPSGQGEDVGRLERKQSISRETDNGHEGICPSAKSAST
ncbi:MAG: replication-associated recombination protein A [Firmicutes bacterium]|nr:replication-associated recombination protein A [Bacillota bacterium]